MPVQEIKDTNWELFCERFAEAHRGTLVTVETLKHDGASTVLARNEPLREFRFQKTDGCSDVIQLSLGEPPAVSLQHEIVEPIHVRLREEAGTQKVLAIDAESGSVELKFSSGRIGAILKDMERDGPR
jgi:hypothetical protein